MSLTKASKIITPAAWLCQGNKKSPAPGIGARDFPKGFYPSTSGSDGTGQIDKMLA